MTTAPLPTSHQVAAAALADLLNSARPWTEPDVELARTLLLFGGAAAETALLTWLEAQHAYPHAFMAHVADALSPTGLSRAAAQVRAMRAGPWRDQALAEMLPHLAPHATWGQLQANLASIERRDAWAQTLSFCIDHVPPSTLDDLVATLRAWQPRQMAVGGDGDTTRHRP